jgi:hypothetical protein
LTVPATTRRAGPFNGNGAATSFPFEFKVFAAADIAVVRADTGGVETTLAPGSNYSVTLNPDQDSDPGGSVTYPLAGAPLPAGSTLVITGAVPYDQTLDLPSGGAFSPRAVENAFDRTVLQIQQLAEQQGRALTLPATAASTDPTLPAPEASKLLGWNLAANGLQNYDAVSLVSAQLFADWVAQSFTGDGVRTQFVLAGSPGSLGNIDVAVGGVTQTASENYSVSGNILTFTSAPSNGARVFVRYGSAAVQQATAFVPEVHTATAGQAVFNLVSSYTPGAGALRAYVGGVRVTNYVETGPNTVAFTSPLFAGQEVLFEVGQSTNSTALASAVAFTGAGAGAVARPVETRLRELVNVKDYGATGDTSADATPAVQAAIAYLASVGGGALYFPRGTYIITQPLVLDFVCHVVGDGVGRTVLQVNHTSGPALTFGRYFSGVRSLQIQGSTARLAASAGTNYGVFFPTDTSVAQSRFSNYVRDVIVNNHPSHGAVVEDSRILSLGGHGVYIDNFDANLNAVAGFIEIKNTQIATCTGHAVCAGVNRGAFRVVLDNVDAFHCALTAGIRQGAHTIWLNAENAVIRSSGIGGWSGNSPSRVAAVAAIYANGRSSLVESNRFIDVAGNAVELGPAADGSRVIDNQLAGEVQGELDPAVLVAAGCVGVQVRWGFPAFVTNAMSLSALNSGNQSFAYDVSMQGVRSNIGRATVADDAAKSWAFRADGGVAWGLALLSFGSSSAESCLVAFRAGDGASYCALLTTAANVNTTTGALTGTTGADAKLTVSVSTSGTPTLYLENRRGTAVDVMPTFLSLGRGELGGVL